MASDPAVVDAAVVATLLADASLMAIATDGIYFDVAPQGKTAFVIVSLQASELGRMFNGIAYDVFTYLVKAVTKGTSGITTAQAAARIDALLENGGAGGSLGTMTNYTLMTTQRADDDWRVRYTETDPDEADIRWQHRGGIYDVWVSPN